MQRSDIYESMSGSIGVKVCGCFQKDLWWWWHSAKYVHFKVPSFKTFRQPSHSCTHIRRHWNNTKLAAWFLSYSVSDTLQHILTHPDTLGKRGLGLRIVWQNVALIISLWVWSSTVHFWKITVSKPLIQSFIHSPPAQPNSPNTCHSESGITGSLLALLSNPHSCVVVKQGLHFFQTSLRLSPV